MGKCLDLDGCGFETRDRARFCGQCGIPTKGSFLQGRYEIRALTGKEHTIVTLQAIDRHGGLPVIVRALIPRGTSTQDREDFLQDAELAASVSERIREAGSICVTDYGQDGPVVFLAKKEFTGTDQHLRNFRMVTRISRNLLASSSPAVQAQNENHTEVATYPRIAPLSDPEITQLQTYTPPPVQRDWLAEGNQAYEQGRYEAALAAYEIATTKDVISVEAWSSKGATLLLMERAEEALLSYNQAISLCPNDPELWTARAGVLHELQRSEEEMYCYDQALTYNPNYTYAWSSKGMALVAQNHLEEALIAFDKALILNPKQASVWQMMSDTLYTLQRYDEALIAIDHAFELDDRQASIRDT